MIEATVYGYLKGELSVPVYMEYPQNPPSSFVLLEKTSSKLENYINSATVAVQSYGKTLYEAALLNETVKVAMLGNGDDEFGIIDQCDISKCALNTDYRFNDLTNKKYRYQAVFDLTY